MTQRFPEWSTVTHSGEETQALGAALGHVLQPGAVVLLMGQLGAGKTTFTQGIAAGLDVHAYTKSPSFVLVNEYSGRLPLFHMDLYRIDDPLEAWDLGLDDYLSRGGVLAVEWGDRAASVFPEDRLEIRITYVSDTEREFRFDALGPGSSDALTRVMSPETPSDTPATTVRDN